MSSLFERTFTGWLRRRIAAAPRLAAPIDEAPADDTAVQQRGDDADQLHAAGLDEVAAVFEAEARRSRPEAVLDLEGQQTERADRPSAYATLTDRWRQPRRANLAEPSTLTPAPAWRPGSAVGMCRYLGGAQ